MGLFGGSKNPEKLIHQAILLMDAKQPKAAISLFKKAFKLRKVNNKNRTYYISFISSSCFIT